jgi:hypothetical protein
VRVRRFGAGWKISVRRAPGTPFQAGCGAIAALPRNADATTDSHCNSNTTIRIGQGKSARFEVDLDGFRG